LTGAFAATFVGAALTALLGVALAGVGFAGAAFTAFAAGLGAIEAVTRFVALAAARVVLTVGLELPLALFWLGTTGDLSRLARTDDRRARELNTAKRG
jgi:3-oxoacyl-(acyl-carrier-protein) synthase